MTYKKIIIFSLLFIVSQLAALCGYLYVKRTVDIQCASTFTRNAWEDYSFIFKGNFLVILKKNGRGELTIRAWTDDKHPRQVMRHYAFHYYIERSGQIYTSQVMETRGASDNVNDDFYRKYFFDLKFDSGGQIRVQRLNNVWLFLSPDLMISACSPLD